MISKDDMKLFMSETEDLLQKTEEDIFKIEENPQAIKPIQNLFYSFHTLKGLTAMAGFENASKFCHYFESFLQKVKDNQLSIKKGDTVVSMLFESLDILKNVLENVKEGKMDDINSSLLVDIKDSLESFETVDDLSFLKHIKHEEFDDILNDKKNHFYKIYIRLQATCVFKKVRIFIIFRALNEHGRLCWGEPDPKSLEKGDINNDFELYYYTHKDKEEIITTLDEILEIENKVLKTLNKTEFRELLISFDEKWQKLDQISQSDRANKLFEPVTEEEYIDGEEEYVSKEFEEYSDTRISSVKVDVNILERLMNYFGEIVILKNQITRTLRDRQDRVLDGILTNMEKPFLDIQELIFKLKLVRVESTFKKYKRLIRDVAKETGKKIRFSLEGINVEIDRKILEELNSPLVHLLRNAVSHGIESPEERVKKKKNQIALLRLKTYRSSGSIYIEVSDDGRGIDYDKIRRILVEKKIFSQDEVSELNQNVLNQYILQPGFSTLENANLLSGRGIGLAIVAEKIRNLGGSLRIHSQKDKGTIFTLIVPFTRAILKAQLFKVEEELFAIPIEYIEQIFRVKQELVEYIDEDLFYKHNYELVPTVHIEKYFRFTESVDDDLRLVSGSKVAILCKKDEENRVLFIVDEILQQTDVIVKPFKSNYADSRDILGSTILDDGSVCLILDVLTIINSIIMDIRIPELNN